MKRSVLFTICMVFLLGFNYYHPNQTQLQTQSLDQDNVRIDVDWGTAEDYKFRDNDSNKSFIVDGDYSDVHFYAIEASDQRGTEVVLKIVPTITITLPNPKEMESLRYKFAIKVRAPNTKCFGYNIKADGRLFDDDPCPTDFGEEKGDEGEDVGDYWWRKLFDSSAPITGTVSTFTIELIGFGRSSVWPDNAVGIEFQIYEIEPIYKADTTPPVVTPDLPIGTINIPQVNAMEFTVQDTGSGLSEVSMWCNFYKFRIDVFSLYKTPAEQAANSALFHHHIGAFTPGTTNEVPITLDTKNLPLGSRFSCGIWAVDMLGHEVLMEREFKVR